MSFTPEQRAKGLATRAANKAKKDARAAKKAAHIEIVSTAGVPNENERRLLDEIKALKAKLGISESARTEAEQRAISAAESQFMDDANEEQPTGKFVTVKRCLNRYKVVGHKDDGREILKPIFEDVKLPTFAYRINMPPVGGNDLKINEVPFYHGAVYILDIETLRTVKEMVFRLWDHDKNIHGSDENAYRQKTHARISARGYG